MIVRRVVATTAGGKSSLVSDELIEPVQPPLIGNEIARLWGFDAMPRPGESQPQDLAAAFFPPPGGFRLVKWTLPPRSHRVAVDDEAAARKQTEAVVPGMSDVAVDEDGLHTTATIDCQFVLSGEIELIAGDGKSTTLRPGDLAVVDGVAHAWRNNGDAPCALLGAFCGVVE
jgi:cupin domain